METTETFENVFEDMSGKFDRFNHVIVCDENGKFFRVIPYIFARNNTKIVEQFTLISIEAYPALKEYAIKDELLIVKNKNASAICLWIDRCNDTIPTIYQEFKELIDAEILDESSAALLIIRLITFLKTIKVGNYNGKGIFWVPENYEAHYDNVEEIDGENREDYIRRLICSHIKTRQLPMAYIIPTNPEHVEMLKKIMEFAKSYDHTDILPECIQMTHFAPMFRNIGKITTSGFNLLIAEEFRCVKNDQYIDGNSSFIFTDEHLDVCGYTIPTNEALENLWYYVGYYLDKLDLSRSFITGSAITASIIKTSRDEKCGRFTSIDLFYPKVITKLTNEDQNIFRDEDPNTWNIMAISTEKGIAKKHDKIIEFSIKSGSDVDIAIDNTVNDDEYCKIAEGHFAVIHEFHPYAKMERINKPKGDWNYSIYTDDPNFIPTFRSVEIYRSSFRNICSHHVGAVRGCYTSRWSDNPKFYLAASAVLTSKYHMTPNYHYFAGRKSNPQDVILKNEIRGIGTLDGAIVDFMKDYYDEKNIVISHLPFYIGKNIPYSIFSTPIEYRLYMEKLNSDKMRKELSLRKIENRRIQREEREREKREREERKREEREREEREREERERAQKDKDQETSNENN